MGNKKTIAIFQALRELCWNNSRRSVTCLILSFLVVIATVCVWAVDVIGFRDEVNIANSPATYSFVPSIYVRPGSQVINIVWREAGGDILYARSQNDGQTFDTRVILPAGGLNRGDPLIAAEATEVVIVWPEGGNLRAVFSADSGATFGDSRAITGSDNVDTSLFWLNIDAVPDVNVTSRFGLAWVRRDGAGDSLFWTTNTDTDATDTFVAPILIDSTTTSPYFSMAAEWDVPGGDDIVVFAWTNANGVFIGEKAGATANTPLTISEKIDGNAGARGPVALQTREEEVEVVWYQFHNGETEVFYDHNKHTDPPDINLRGAYAADRRLSTSGDGCNAVGKPSIRLDPLNIHIVWFEQCAGAPVGRIVHVQAVTDFSGGPAGPSTISSPASVKTTTAVPRGQAGISARTNHLHVAYQDTQGLNADIFAIRSRADLVGPKIASATYFDGNSDSVVSQGDTLSIVFSEQIVVDTLLVPSDFNLPVTGNSLGTTNLTSQISYVTTSETLASDTTLTTQVIRSLVLTLGPSPVLTIAGTFDTAVTSATSPSGIDFVNNATVLAKIKDVDGNSAGITGGVDIGGTTPASDTSAENADSGPAAPTGDEVCVVSRHTSSPMILSALRSFREKILSNTVGRLFVRAYYSL